MKVYLFFIEDELLVEHIGHIYPCKTFDYISGRNYALYAFTTKKKYRDEFISTHKDNLFICITQDMDQDEYKKFWQDNLAYQLNEYDYENNKKKVTIVSTEEEFNQSRMWWIQCFSENLEVTLSHLTDAIIQSLNSKYFDALAKLGLNTFIFVADDEFGGFIENAPYGFDDDYVLSMDVDTKDSLGRKAIIHVEIAGKTLNSYIHIFKNILK